MAERYRKLNYTLRTIWGIAKSPELHMTDDELHELVSGHMGKDSLKELTPREIAKVVNILSGMKESVRKQERRKGHPSVRGNPSTANQRKKVYKLCEELDWKDPARVNGMCRRMFQIDRLEWLNYRQCSDLIEALKAMAERQKNKEATTEEEGE